MAGEDGLEQDEGRRQGGRGVPGVAAAVPREVREEGVGAGRQEHQVAVGGHQGGRRGGEGQLCVAPAAAGPSGETASAAAAATTATTAAAAAERRGEQ